MRHVECLIAFLIASLIASLIRRGSGMRHVDAYARASPLVKHLTPSL